jgi:pantothenate synthetase
VSLVDGATLQSVPLATAGCVLAVAAALGPVRLIDNVVLRRTASAVTAADNEETPAHA